MLVFPLVHFMQSLYALSDFSFTCYNIVWDRRDRIRYRPLADLGGGGGTGGTCSSPLFAQPRNVFASA